MSAIHPTAIIAPGAKLGKNVQVGPYCIIGENVSLGDNSVLKAHVVLDGRTTIGEGTTIYPFASIGTPPQDLKFKGEPSQLVIGKNTIIREHVTMNPGTEGGGMLTQVGDNCLFMVGVHIAHDCKVGNHVVMANNATLAGHVEVGDHVVIGGLAAARQFLRIGKHAMIGGLTALEADVIPYGTAVNERGGLIGLNLVGLKRRNFSREDINSLRSAYRLMFSPEGTLQERLQDVAERFKDCSPVMEIVEFIGTDGSRPICQPKNTGNKDAHSAAA